MITYEPVIGFEIHVELKTLSKMFCGCPADHFGKPPNSQTCPVCLGLPGALPVPNAKAIDWCLKLGLALGCQVNLHSKFDRKNYFYPDLPKGYQISQYDQPFCHSGHLALLSGKNIRITRVHMEEDTAKMQHTEINGEKLSLIDFNRSGVPLVEVVTEPDFSSSDEAVEFLKEIQVIVRDLDISTADMEKGSMRLEANISMRPQGQTKLPEYKVEIKNVNSFRFIKKSMDFEQSRQTQLLNSGVSPVQETRGFNESKGETVSQRRKEQAHDYRYFPEPDIPPFVFSPHYIESIRRTLPKLSSVNRQELSDTYGLSTANAYIICSDHKMYTYFIHLASTMPDKTKYISDFIINKRYGEKFPETPEKLLALINESQNSFQIDPKILSEKVSNILSQYPQAVSDYQSGKIQARSYLIGQVKKSLGNVETAQISMIIKELYG